VLLQNQTLCRAWVDLHSTFHDLSSSHEANRGCVTRPPMPIELPFTSRMVVQGCMRVRLPIVLEVGPLRSEPVRVRFQARLQQYMGAPE
jgi:hypothetical protein